jgi:hypothetical protein
LTAVEYDSFSRYAPLDIGGTGIEIDTNNFGEIDYEGLYANLRKVQERLNEAP